MTGHTTIFFLWTLATALFPKTDIEIITHHQDIVGKIQQITHVGDGPRPQITLCGDSLAVSKNKGKWCVITLDTDNCIFHVSGDSENWAFNGNYSLFTDAAHVDSWISCVKDQS